jgi:hypothetical protein
MSEILVSMRASRPTLTDSACRSRLSGACATAALREFLSVPHSQIDKWLISTRPSQTRCTARNKARFPPRSLQLVWRPRCRNCGGVQALFRSLVNTSDGPRLAITITPGRLSARPLIDRGCRCRLLCFDFRRHHIRQLGAWGWLAVRWRLRHRLPLPQLRFRWLGRRCARPCLVRRLLNHDRGRCRRARRPRLSIGQCCACHFRACRCGQFARRPPKRCTHWLAGISLCGRFCNQPFGLVPGLHGVLLPHYRHGDGARH